MEHSYEQFVNTQNLLEFVKKLMDEDAAKYFPLIYKIMLSMTDQNDVTSLLNLLKTIYETGFNRSVKAHQQTLQQMGLKAQIKN